jgi:hypothetical protein
VGESERAVDDLLPWQGYTWHAALATDEDVRAHGQLAPAHAFFCPGRLRLGRAGVVLRLVAALSVAINGGLASPSSL